MKLLILSPAEKRVLREKYDLAQSTINYALAGKRDTALVRIIREKAEEIIKARDLETEVNNPTIESHA